MGDGSSPEPQAQSSVRSVCGEGCAVPAVHRWNAFLIAAVVTGVICLIRIEDLELNIQAVMQTASEAAKGGFESAMQYLAFRMPRHGFLVFWILVAISILSGLVLGVFKRYRTWRHVLGAGLAVPTTLISAMVITVKVLKYYQHYLTVGN